MNVHNYTVFFEPLGEGGYNVVVPAIPEICTFGETLAEAKAMAEEALRCYLESAMQLGEEIPADVVIDREPVKERLEITLKAA